MVVATNVQKICMISLLVGAVVLFGLAGFLVGHAFGAGGQASYAGQQVRAIKSLSAEDVAAIKAGKGWGFAKPAELNGYPGPLHVLELATELKLTDEQKQQVQAVFAKMKAEAQKAGKVFLDAETALDSAFASGNVTADKIVELTLASATARSVLQSVHLNAHLETTPLLTDLQRHRYAKLRGYAGGEPGSHSGQPKTKGSHSGH